MGPPFVLIMTWLMKRCRRPTMRASSPWHDVRNVTPRRTVCNRFTQLHESHGTPCLPYRGRELVFLVLMHRKKPAAAHSPSLISSKTAPTPTSYWNPFVESVFRSPSRPPSPPTPPTPLSLPLCSLKCSRPMCSQNYRSCRTSLSV